MAEVTLTLNFRPRWWFEPACKVAVLLIALGAIRDTYRASRWLVEHGTVIEAV